MKNTTIIITLVLFSFGFSQMGRTDIPQPHIFFDDVFPQDEENIDLPEGEKISHFSNSTRTDRTPWEEVSPINGAAINEITVSISDPNIVYATTYGNGVFKSTDAGNTWSPTALINKMGTFDGLAISPIDPNIVFASVYDFGHYTGGVYKTIDGGETWTTIEYFGNTYVRGIFIDPSSPQTIFTYRGQTNYYGYEYSTDGGETWAYNDLYNIDNSGISIYGFHGDPEDSCVVFAHGSRGKVVRILDSGSTGTIEHDVSEFAYYLGSMDISESNPDRIYLGTSDGFLFTLNGGNSWTLLDEEFGYDPYNDDSTIPNSTAVYDVVVHPENDNEVWFQSRDFGPFRSLDGGFTIESMMPPIMDTWGYELAFSSTDGHVLFGPWWKGLWRFDGESWLESSDGLKHQFINDLFITEDMEIWSGNDRHAVSKSSDNGLSWDNYNAGMESWYTRSMSVDPSGNHALVNTNAGPYMTSNSGSDWTNTDDQLDYRMGFYRSNAEPNTVYAAGYELMDSYYGTTTNWKIMRSENQGQDWDTNLEFSVPEDYRIYEMGVDHGDANNLVAIVRYSGNGYSGDVEYTTWFSDDGGESWNSDNININDFPSSGMRSFIRINNEWYCTTWGYGFYKYSNGWQQVGYGLPENAYLGQMLYNPLPDNALYVVTWGAGVYVSYDLGETFEPMNDGLTNLGVISIGSGITDEGLVTMVGTYGGNYKIVQSSVPEISIDPDTLDFGLVYIGYPDTLDLTIFNEGLSALTVESIDVDGNGFSLASGQNFPIEVFAPEPLNVSVVFGGDTQGAYAGTLTITSNDGDETPLIVNLYGSLAGPPILSVSPDSLYSALFTGETDTQILTITNEGGSDLHFSINLLNVNTRPHVNIEPGNGPTLSIQDVQDFWHSDHEYSSSGSGRPGTTTPTRTTRSWQLLANDPQDNNSPYDTENIYYEVTDTSLNFKYEYYEPWEDAEGNTVAMVFMNIDNDTETGETIEGYELIWEGIDAIIYSTGLDDFEDGIYIYTEDYYGYYGYGEFVFYEPLAWRVAEDNTNEFSFAVSNELFQGLTSSRIASWSGSLNYDPDTVPNEGMLDLYFRPAWLSIELLDSVITVGSALDLSVTFDAASLFGGDYHAVIQINSNDPSTPEFDLPAHLSVIGSPNISLDSNNINFGTTFVNNIDTLTLVITNDGTDVLDISSITIDNTVFGLSLSSATIDYGSSTQLEITFSPLEAGDYNGLITIISNDSDESTLDVSVSGIGAEPPIITVISDSLYSALFTGETDTQILTITNDGGSDLEWEIDISENRSASNNNRNIGFYADESRTPAGPVALPSNVMSRPGPNNDDGSRDEGDVLNTYVLDDHTKTGCIWMDGLIYYIDYSEDYLKTFNPSTQEVVTLFALHSEPFGIAWDGEYLWIGNNAGNVYGYDLSGNQIGSFSGPFYSYPALTWDGEYFLAAESFDDDPIYKLDHSGSVVSSYSNNVEAGEMISLGWVPGHDGGNLWMHDDNSMLYRLNLNEADANAELITSFSSPSFIPYGTLGHDGTDLWVMDGYTYYYVSYLYQIDDGIEEQNWLYTDSTSGTIPAGSSENINVFFDATGLFGGDYSADIIITSNDPENPEMNIPVQLSVTGAPNINVETDSIDFGVTYTNFGGTEQISIGNNGTDVLEVSSITVDNDVFSLSESNATIGYGDEFTLEVEFLPLESGDHSGTITIVSNDSNEPEITIVLVGNSIAPPVINVSPDSLYSALFTGETDTQILTITNEGGSDLDWSLNISTDGRGILDVEYPLVAELRKGLNLNIPMRSHSTGLAPEAPLNSPIDQNVVLLDRDTEAYGYMAYDPNDPYAEYPFRFDLENPGSIIPFGSAASNFIATTDWVDDVWYGIIYGEYYESTLITIDMESGEYTNIGSTVNAPGMAYDWTTETMYAVDFAGGLYTIDLETGAYTQVAWTQSNLITIACSNDGILYGFDLNTDTIGVIDKDTGAWTQIGAAGFDFSYAQDASFDHATNTLYWAAYDVALGGELVTVDLATGAASLVGAFPGGMEVTGFAIPGRPDTWVLLELTSGTIPAGSSENINVLFDATGLFGGDYHAVIQINSNDPSTPEFDLPAHLSVTGAPNINMETDSIDFGVTYTNFGGTEQIGIGNNGTDVLEVSSITVDNDVFSLSESNATIGYGDEFTLEVEFLPLESGDHSGTITIVSNDSNEPEITIVLVGNSIAPPVINVSPDSLYSALSTGETETQIITILNNGMSDLEYDINIYGSTDGDPYALGFNGSNNYVSFDNQTIQSMIGGNWANEKTISAWIKPVGSSPNISSGWEGDAIYGQASGSGNFFGISRGIIGGEDRIWVYNWDGNDDRIGIEYENFEWVHIALVQDNGMLYGYKNGELIGQVNTGASGTAGYQRIGGGTDNGGYFQGFLDEIRIWSVARTQDEIQSNASHELSGDEDNLVGYWKFNEGAGTLVNDETSNGNHGSVIGASWIFSDAVVYTSWIGVSPANGIIIPGASSDINLEFNSQGLDAGTYTTSLLINSNDPVSPVINIPATLEIEFLGNDNAGLIPAEFALYQNYPNPFNPVTTIRFDIPVETYRNTSLRIYDITGRVVETLVNEKLEPGQHEIQWNASQHSSGVYFLRMNAVSFIKTQKMILLK